MESALKKLNGNKGSVNLRGEETEFIFWILLAPFLQQIDSAHGWQGFWAQLHLMLIDLQVERAWFSKLYGVYNILELLIFLERAGYINNALRNFHEIDEK